MQFNTSYLWGVPSFEEYQNRYNRLPNSHEQHCGDHKEETGDELKRVPPITQEDLDLCKTLTNQYDQRMNNA